MKEFHNTGAITDKALPVLLAYLVEGNWNFVFGLKGCLRVWVPAVCKRTHNLHLELCPDLRQLVQLIQNFIYVLASSKK